MSKHPTREQLADEHEQRTREICGPKPGAVERDTFQYWFDRADLPSRLPHFRDGAEWGFEAGLAFGRTAERERLNRIVLDLTNSDGWVNPHDLLDAIREGEK